MSDQTTALQRWEALDLARPQDQATVFVQSGFFNDAKSASQAMVKILAGKELGLPAFAAMQGIDIIQGRCRITSNTLAAMVKKSRDYDYRVREWDEEQCRIEFFVGSRGEREPLGFGEFTMKEAQRAGLVRDGGNWKKWPKAMLFARAMSNGVRAHCPDVTAGVTPYTEGDFEGPSNGFHAEPSTKTSDLDAALDEPEDEEVPGKYGGAEPADEDLGISPAERAHYEAAEEADPKTPDWFKEPQDAPWEDD